MIRYPLDDTIDPVLAAKLQARSAETLSTYAMFVEFGVRRPDIVAELRRSEPALPRHVMPL